jgi:putative membrane protein
MHWGNYGYGMGYGWGMGFGWIFMIIFLILIILCAVYLIKLIFGAGKREEREDTPLQILKKRYARGEITKDEYDGIKKELES